MDLCLLKDVELNEKVKSLAAQERSLTEVVIRHIAEVDKRKLYLRRAYSSLFDYLVKEIGYSAGAAQRRIDAARLLQVVPELSLQIEAGTLHLSQISKMQKVCRQLKKESGQAVQAAVQKAVLRKLENKTAEQTDLILAQEFNIEIVRDERRSIQSDESVRLELTLSKEEMALIKRAQDLLSNKTGGGLKATLLEMATRTVTDKTMKTTSQTSAAKCESTATVAVKFQNQFLLTKKENLPQHVTPRLRREILSRDHACQFKDHTTGRQCGATAFLEIDHIRPRFAGGDNNPQNLRVLCKAHNVYRYQHGL